MSDPEADDLKCRELVELVSDYLGDALSAEEKARFDRHLLGCPPCTVYLAQMKATIDRIRNLQAEPAQALEPRLLEVFRSWHHQ